MPWRDTFVTASWETLRTPDHRDVLLPCGQRERRALASAGGFKRPLLDPASALCRRMQDMRAAARRTPP